MKLLLIEDNSTIASQLVTFFEGLGWVVDYAATGGQGVELARGADNEKLEQLAAFSAAIESLLITLLPWREQSLPSPKRCPCMH